VTSTIIRRPRARCRRHSLALRQAQRLHRSVTVEANFRSWSRAPGRCPPSRRRDRSRPVTSSARKPSARASP
jgi:hypothetical protein